MVSHIFCAPVARWRSDIELIRSRARLCREIAEDCPDDPEWANESHEEAYACDRAAALIEAVLGDGDATMLASVFPEAFAAIRGIAEPTKDAAAVSLGRRGGLRGGKARAEKLTPEERSRIAKIGAEKRWGTRRAEDGF